MDLLRSALVSRKSCAFFPQSRYLVSMSIGLFMAVGGTPNGSFEKSCHAQVVQLPNQRHFKLRASAQVPDGGSTQLGSASRGGVYSARSPGSIANKRTQGSSSTSVHATVIDLDELDRMIRCHAEDTPIKIKLRSHENQQQSSQGTVARNKVGCKEPPARYDYIMSMSHNSGTTPANPSSSSLDDARYYLQFADKATRRGEWSNAEFFYNLAWDHLPAERRTLAVKDLLEARAARIAANAERAHSATRRSRVVD